MKPIYFREPSINLGVGAAKGQMPHVTGADFRKAYGIDDGSPSAYALTYNDFSSMAQAYGKVGGMDRVATVVNSFARIVQMRCCWMAAIPGMGLTPVITPKVRMWSM